MASCTVDEPLPQTAGVMTLGTVWLNIPPGAEDYEESGVCPSWMTRVLPPHA